MISLFWAAELPEDIGSLVEMMNNSGKRMNKRNVVTFSADFSDDSQWGEQGIEIVPGGQAITQAIKSQLQQQGISCSDIAQHDTYGWAFNAELDKSRIQVLLAAAEGGWLVQLVPRQSVIGLLLGRPEAAGLETVRRNLHDTLAEDKRFFDIKWHTKADYDSCNESAASDSPY
ncbi:hypothetical protein [Blastopirellula marina]|uniref:Uncharacterized protein n=1 Tax=Blastopirellula marina TaxID=124 RepID=A0A2S8GFV2_9BACT|nr:hypothetical protein [Blastopirellula marina]PQO42924.1 hypothetical protein C5Y93_24685 [Blastopirellula marina]